MPAGNISTRPFAPDGTTDWEEVFEDENTGLIPLIGQAHTRDALRAYTIIVLEKLLIRKNDHAAMERLTRELDRIIAAGGEGAAGLDASKDAITTLLRQIKEIRKQMTAAYVASKKAETGGDRRHADRGADTGGRKPAIGTAGAGSRRAVTGDSPAQKRRRLFLYAAWAALIVGLTTLVLVLVLVQDTKTDGSKETVWLREYVTAHLPDQTWKLASVGPTEESTIALEVLVTDPRHVKIIKGVSRMDRVEFLSNVCPPEDSGVMFIIDNGWSLWVTLKAEDEILTGGTCHYRRESRR